MCFSFLFFFPFLAFGEQRLGGWGAVFFNQFFLSLSLSLCVSMCTKAIGDIFHLFLSIFPWKKEQTRLRPLPHLFRWKPRSSCARIENWNAKKKTVCIAPAVFLFLLQWNVGAAPLPLPLPTPTGQSLARERHDTQPTEEETILDLSTQRGDRRHRVFLLFFTPPLSLSFGAAKKSAP